MSLKKLLTIKVFVFVMFVGLWTFAACAPAQAPEEEGVADEKKAAEQENETDEAAEEPTVTYPVTIQDHMGEEVVIEHEPENVVSLLPNLTETLFALELGESVAGVSNLCNYPEEVEEKPRVGDAFDINLEKIATLEPDVVLMGVGEVKAEARGQLEDMDINTAAFNPENIAEIQEMILTLGEVFDRLEKAETIVTEMQEQTEDLEDQVAELETKPSVFVLLDTESLYTVGSGEFMHEVIEKAGAENIAAEAGEGYFELSQEKLLALDPEVIITTFPESAIEGKGALEELSAVEDDQVYEVDGDLLSRPGPRILDGVRELHELLHQ